MSSSNLLDVGYAKIKRVDSITSAITYRYVDILIEDECKEIVEPYFFLYDYGQANRTMDYSIPLEGLNYSEINNLTTSMLGSNIPSHNKILKYTNSIFFPQAHISEAEGSLVTKPVSRDVATGSKDTIDGNSMGHMYIMLKKDEVELQIYKRHNNLSDPYNLSSTPEVVLNEAIVLSNSDLELRSIVVTLSTDDADINYAQAIFGDEVKNPVKWVISHPVKSVKSLPSVNYVNDLLDDKITVSQSHLKVNGINLGKLVTNKIDINSDPIYDMHVIINNTSITIDGVTLTNAKPF